MANKKFASVQNPIKGKDEVISKTSIVLQNLMEGDKPEYQYIRIDNIQFNPLNDYAENDDEQSIADLAEDIRINGLLHNIVVVYTKKGEYKLLSGERRLRAYKYLYATTKDEKYAEIYALIRKDLSDIDEMLIMDAANLQTRDGMSGEKRMRKATVRFVENIKAKFGVDDKLAVSLAKKLSSSTATVIDQNLLIESKLNKVLLEFFDAGIISKKESLLYATLDESVQDGIAESLMDVRAAGTDAVKRLSEDTASQIKSLDRKEKVAKNLRVLIEEMELAILDAQNKISVTKSKAAIERLNEYIASLEKRKSDYEASLAEIEKLLHKKNEPAVKSSGGVAGKVKKCVDKIARESSVFESPAIITKICKLSKTEKDSIIVQLQSCVENMQTVLRAIEEG